MIASKIHAISDQMTDVPLDRVSSKLPGWVSELHEIEDEARVADSRADLQQRATELSTVL